MARYIDADWIYKIVENRYRVSSGIEHRCECGFLDLICEASTADVVPKSEVARLQEDVDRLNEINEGLVRELSELRKQIELDKRSQEIDKIVRRRLGDFL